MSLVNDFRAGDDEIFALFGVDAVLTRVTQGAYEPAKGRVTEQSNQPLAIVVKLSKQEITTDSGATKIVQLASCREELKAGDLLTVNGTTFRVVDASPKMVKGVITKWKAILVGATLQ